MDRNEINQSHDILVMLARECADEGGSPADAATLVRMCCDHADREYVDAINILTEEFGLISVARDFAAEMRRRVESERTKIPDLVAAGRMTIAEANAALDRIGA